MKPLAIADDHGSTCRVAPCDDDTHAWIRVTDSHGQIANVCVLPKYWTYTPAQSACPVSFA